MQIATDVIRRVLNAKYALERAQRFQDEKSDMSYALSLLMMHDAVEMLMIATLDHLQIKVKEKREFKDFWAEIKQAGHPDPPDAVAMLAMNKMRVNLKHYGNLPNLSQAHDSLARCKGFFENVLSQYFDIPFDDLSLADLVSNQEARELLAQAQRDYTSGDKEEAFTNVRVAFDVINRSLKVPTLKAPQAPSIPSDLAPVRDYIRHLHGYLATAAAAINSLSIGIDPRESRAFFANTPAVSWSLSGLKQVQIHRNYQGRTDKLFRFCFNFVVDFSLKSEQSFTPFSLVEEEVNSAAAGSVV